MARPLVDLSLPPALVAAYSQVESQGLQGTLNKVAEVCSSVESIKTWWMNTDPIISGSVICFAVAMWCLVYAPLVNNYSQVDKMWSVIPVVYAWNFALVGNFHPRLMLIAGVLTVWGVRLTYNFWRRGGYHGEEDYRWVHVRAMCKHWILFQLMNLFFIATYQHVLLYAIVFPAHTAWTASSSELNNVDYIAAGCVLFFIVFETIADQQQWNFQNEKYRLIKAKVKRTGDYLLGFNTSGLFRYSRKPNYFGEQMVWVSVYLFSISSGAAYVNWTLVGAANLILLFQGSTNMTENLTIAKYPKYKEYQKVTSMFIPMPPSGKVKSQ